MVCTIDMEKAYDKLDWDFLFFLLRMIGFGNRWLMWMESCIVEPFFSILINETSKGFFKSSKRELR